MATITTDSLVRQEVLPSAPQGPTYTIASWNMGSMSSSVQVKIFGFTNPFSAVGPQAVYRGRIGTAYVYSIGSPPGGGAIEIAIVGYQ